MRTGVSVQKINKNGEVIQTYPSLNKAFKSEGVGLIKLKEAIEQHTELNGHTFSMAGELPKRSPNRPIPPKEEQYFNIERWRSLCF